MVVLQIFRFALVCSMVSDVAGSAFNIGGPRTTRREATATVDSAGEVDLSTRSVRNEPSDFALNQTHTQPAKTVANPTMFGTFATGARKDQEQPILFLPLGKGKELVITGARKTDANTVKMSAWLHKDVEPSQHECYVEQNGGKKGTLMIESRSRCGAADGSEADFTTMTGAICTGQPTKYDHAMLACKFQEKFSTSPGQDVSLKLTGAQFNGEVPFTTPAGYSRDLTICTVVYKHNLYEAIRDGKFKDRETFERESASQKLTAEETAYKSSMDAVMQKRMVQWLEHSRLQGVDHVVLYDVENAVSQDVKDAYQKDGFLTVLDWSRHLDFSSSDDPNTQSEQQVAHQNHCLLSQIGLSKHVLAMDVDEYLLEPHPVNDLNEFELSRETVFSKQMPIFKDSVNKWSQNKDGVRVKLLNKGSSYWKCWSPQREDSMKSEGSYNPFGLSLLQVFEKHAVPNGCCVQEGKHDEWQPRFWAGQSKYLVATSLLAKYPYMAAIHDLNIKFKDGQDWQAKGDTKHSDLVHDGLMHVAHTFGQEMLFGCPVDKAGYSLKHVKTDGERDKTETLLVPRSCPAAPQSAQNECFHAHGTTVHQNMVFETAFVRESGALNQQIANNPNIMQLLAKIDEKTPTDAWWTPRE